MNYFISDLHLGHKNCLIFDNRPFKSITEHDNQIIENWNHQVNPSDDVYLLGDISWYDADKTAKIFAELNGNIHLIKGNHDGKLLKNRELRSRFCEIADYKELYIGPKTGIVLCHYPMPCFKNHHYCWYHFYGHVHNGTEDELMNQTKQQIITQYNVPCNMYNVGCMMPYMMYTPQTFDYIISSEDEDMMKKNCADIFNINSSVNANVICLGKSTGGKGFA